MKFQLDRQQFGQTIAEAVLASAKSRLAVLVYFDLSDGTFELTNTTLSYDEFIPIVEIDAKRSEEDFPLHNAELLAEALEAVSEQASSEMFDQMLPNMIEQIAQNLPDASKLAAI